MKTRQNGFTLLEVLLVITVVGIAISMARLSLNNGGQDYSLEAEARKFLGMVKLVQDQAVVSNRPLGLRFYSEGFEPRRYTYYDWLVNDGDNWVVYKSDQIFVRHKLPATLLIDVDVEGEPVQTDASLAKDKLPMPQLIFNGSDDSVPFVIAFKNTDTRGKQYRIQRIYPGDIEMQVIAENER